MTTAAMVLINALTFTPWRRRSREAIEARHLIGIDVENSIRRIDCRTAPLAAAPRAWQHNIHFIQAVREELALTDEPVKLFQSPVMRLGSSIRHHIPGQDLPRKGRRRGGYRLSLRSNFARSCAGCETFFGDREQWFAGSPIKEKNKARLGRLCNCIYPLSIAHHCQQRRRRWKISVPDIVMHALKVPDTLSSLRIQSQQGV